VVYEDAVAKTGKLDYNAYTVDMFYERPIQETGAITLSAAYENIDFDDAYMGMNPDPGTCGLNGQKNGWYAKAGYLLVAGHAAAALFHHYFVRDDTLRQILPDFSAKNPS